MTISGALTASFGGSGRYQCTDALNAASSATLEIGVLGSEGSQLTFYLPVNALAGDYRLTAPSDEPPLGTQAAASLALADGTRYTIRSGTLTLTEFASGPDQPIIGRFEFTAQAGEQMVTVSGAFDYSTLGAREAAQGIDLSAFFCGDK